MERTRHVNLSKVKTCHQYWSEMQEVPGGRLCQQCQKTIVDFRGKSSSEVAWAHMNSETAVCGIYDKKLLHSKPAPAQQQSLKNWLRNRWLACLSFVALSIDAPAQEAPLATEKVEQPIKNQESAMLTVTTSPAQDSVVTVKGTVIAKEEKGKEEPVPFANVWVKNTKYGVATDFDGNFLLDLTSFKDSTLEVTLVIQYIGYNKREFLVPTTTSSELNVTLTAQDISMVAFSVPVRRSIPRRVWYTVTRPFRKKNR